MSAPSTQPKPQPAGEAAGTRGSRKWEAKKITLKIPADWWPVIDEYMKKHGYTSFPELLRDLIREKIIEAGQQ